MKNNFRKGFFMEKSIGALWIGGDKRQIVAENVMNELGWNTAVCLNSEIDLAKGKQYENLWLALKENKIILFPLPITKDGVFLNCAMRKLALEDIFDRLQSDALVLGGNIPETVCCLLKQKGIRFIDYYNEELQIGNALLTAEGAVGIALCEMPITLSGANCFVVGYGRIGKILALKLQLLGANVTVGARKPTDLAFAKAYGYETLCIQDGIPSNRLPQFDVIFNTVPVRLFDGNVLKAMNKRALYIELASFPYGIDPEKAVAHEIRLIQAGGLPGKYAPISAGQILAENVVRILSKEDIAP